MFVAALGSSLSDIARKTVADTIVEFQSKGLRADEIAISISEIDRKGGTYQTGACRGDLRFYPASVVKLFYIVHLANRLGDGSIKLTPELNRAAKDMIVESVNDATAMVVDTITDTTGGPELPPDKFKEWGFKRNLVNRWYAERGFKDQNICQKPWNEGPYGRERQWVGENYENRNMLTPDACVRLMSEIALDKSVPYGKLATPAGLERSGWMKGFLSRKPVADGGKDDEQSADFTGSVLPKGFKLWSKAGWTDTVRHDVAWIQAPDGREYVWAIFTKAHSQEKIVPFAASRLLVELGLTKG